MWQGELGTQLLAWFLWGGVINLGAEWILRAAYASPISALRLKRPKNGTPAALSHMHAAWVAVGILHVAYCIFQSIRSLNPSAYSILGVHVQTSEREIKRRFHELAKVHHPDIAGASNEDYFLKIHSAYAVLSDTTLRFAYDRFWLGGLANKPTGLPGRVTTCAMAYVYRRRNASKCLRRKGLLGFFEVAAIPRTWVLAPWYVCLTHPQWSFVLLLSLYLAWLHVMFAPRLQDMWLLSVWRWPPFQIFEFLFDMFFPCMMLLQQLDRSMAQFLRTGRWGHFRLATSSAPVYEESPEESSQMLFTEVYSKVPETLAEAQQQIHVLTSGIQQLHDKVVAHAAEAPRAAEDD